MTCILSKAPLLYRAVFRKNIIFGPITKLTLARGCKHLTNKTNIRTEQRFKLKDNVSNDYKLIYREQNLVMAITSATYHMGWIGNTLVLGSMVYLFYDIFVLQTPQNEELHDFLGYKMKPLRKLSQFDLTCLCILITVVLIKYSKIIPFRIYHNPTEKLYKVVFVKSLLQGQTVTFTEGSAVPVFKNMGDVLFYINSDRMILLDGDSFPVPSQREKMICRFT